MLPYMGNTKIQMVGLIQSGSLKCHFHFSAGIVIIKKIGPLRVITNFNYFEVI